MPEMIFTLYKTKNKYDKNYLNKESKYKCSKKETALKRTASHTGWLMPPKEKIMKSNKYWNLTQNLSTIIGLDIFYLPAGLSSEALHRWAGRFGFLLLTSASVFQLGFITGKDIQ
jgi:hypothetical protein